MHLISNSQGFYAYIQDTLYSGHFSIISIHMPFTGMKKIRYEKIEAPFRLLRDMI